MSEVKVNKISPRTACGTTTLGDSGDTFTIPSGVTITNNGTQTGFGRTGTVDWQTGSIKTATFTAANGEGYFANTSGGAFTMNLPAGTAGNIVSVVDYTNTFQTNNLTISANGSQKIGGVAADIALNTEGQSVTLVYVDDTEGWKNVQDSTSNVVGNNFITATGGTITECGNDKIHTFTGPGTFTVSAVSACAANNVVSHLVVAGGAGGGAGGGGAGGFREVKSPVTPYTASPLDGYPSAPNRVTVSATAYPITVGGGGAGNPGPNCKGNTGSNSVFSTITSNGGGGGAVFGSAPAATGNNGGSGGGGARNAGPQPGGTGNSPPVSPPQGNNGGSGFEGGCFTSGGGGGAGAVGTNATPNDGGPGGAGVATSISGSSVTRAGGGGGSRRDQNSGGSGGPGGGGNGGGQAGGSGTPAVSAGTANTGGGGGGGEAPSLSPNVNGQQGGSGIVIIRYKFQ